jgi:hypothetical protein
MKMILVRWDSVVRKAADLRLQDCTWGGFQGRILPFVPLDSPWVDMWGKECSLHHKCKVVPSFYEMELPTISQEDFIRISLEGYTNKSTELTRKGIFVSLIEIEKRTYAIAEVRFTKPHPLQYLTDAE